MSTKGTLEDRLRKLAGAGVAGPDGRAIRSSSPTRLLARLLQEIAETVLPRALKFQSDAGRAMRVVAANGRLLRIERVDGLAMVPEDLVGDSFETGDTETAARLKPVFMALTKGTDTILVQSGAQAAELDPERAGLLAGAIAGAWGIPIDTGAGSDPGEAMDSFLASAGTEARAWYLTRPGGGPGEGAGDPDTVEELAAFAEAQREAGETARLAETAGGDPWVFLTLHRAPEAPDATVIVLAGDLLVYLSVARDRVGDMADRWRIASG